MKNIRILGLLSVAASALMAFPGIASATTITSPSGTVYTGTLKSEAEGHLVLDNPIAAISCASTEEWSIEKHGAGVTAAGQVTGLDYTNCTNSWHITVISKGSYEVHPLGGGNGTVTSSGRVIDATRFGITCKYKTENTHLGTVTGGTPARFHYEGQFPFWTGSPLCGGIVPVTGTYRFTTPGGWVPDP